MLVGLALIGGVTSQTDGSGVQPGLGVLLVGYMVYRFFTAQGEDDSDESP